MDVFWDCNVGKVVKFSVAGGSPGDVPPSVNTVVILTAVEVKKGGCNEVDMVELGASSVSSLPSSAIRGAR